MRLLVFSPWFPCPPDNGSRQRAFHLLRCWAEAGHTISLVTGLQADFADHADLESIQRLCHSVQVFPWRWHNGDAAYPLRNLFSSVPRSIRETDNPALRTAIEKCLLQKPDACIAMELASAPFIPLDTKGIPVILDQVEVSTTAQSVQQAAGIAAKCRALLTQIKHDRYWQKVLKRFTALTAVSSEEADAVRSLVPNGQPPICVVPNGVDTMHYYPSNRAPVPGRILYNGSLTYPPNRDAVTWFVDAILPNIVRHVPDVHLVVTGRVSPEIASLFAGRARISFTGFVPDLRPVIASAVVCAVPLRTGGGTRLKILEAWAGGIPVVSTSIGAMGLDGGAADTHLLVADSAERFASACTRLLTEPETGRRLAKHARGLVEARYNWNTIAEQVIELTRIAH